MIYELFNAQQAKVLMDRIWPEVKANLTAGHKMLIDIKLSNRTLEQNAKFHAMIGDIAKQMKQAGSTWTEDDWKRLLIDQWAHETNRKIGRVAPSLDGERVVQLGHQTRKFSIDWASDFIEWLYAWSAEKGIEL